MLISFVDKKYIYLLLRQIGMGKKTMVAGRPTKYKPEYCELIIEKMSKGLSVVQFAAEIGVAKHSIYEWADVHPKFSDALKKGQTACEGYWERIIQAKSVKKLPGSDALLKFWMQNRFRWSEKVDQNIKSEESITFTTQIGDDGTVNREQS